MKEAKYNGECIMTCDVKHSCSLYTGTWDWFEGAGLTYLHCKNKLAFWTTQWLPWLQTDWRDNG